VKLRYGVTQLEPITTMILQLDDNYRIATDEYNFVLQRKMDPEKNPRKGKRATSAEKWKNIGYWKDLSQLLASYTRQVLRSKRGKTTFTAISRDLRTLTQAIERIGEQCVGLWGRD